MSKVSLGSFGIFCRKLRLDNGELLYDMASKLGVSPAFLSKVENGISKPPAGWRNILTERYRLDEEKLRELDAALYEANNSKKIDLSPYSQEEKDLMLSFARRLKSMDHEKWRKLLDDEGA